MPTPAASTLSCPCGRCWTRTRGSSASYAHKGGRSGCCTAAAPRQTCPCLPPSTRPCPHPGSFPRTGREVQRSVHRTRFLDDASTVLFVGLPRVGKTRLAVALTRAEVDAGHRAYCGREELRHRKCRARGEAGGRRAAAMSSVNHVADLDGHARGARLPRVSPPDAYVLAHHGPAAHRRRHHRRAGRAARACTPPSHPRLWAGSTARRWTPQRSGR